MTVLLSERISVTSTIGRAHDFYHPCESAPRELSGQPSWTVLDHKRSNSSAGLIGAILGGNSRLRRAPVFSCSVIALPQCVREPPNPCTYATLRPRLDP